MILELGTVILRILIFVEALLGKRQATTVVNDVFPRICVDHSSDMGRTENI